MTVVTQDHRIVTDRGELFARSWVPSPQSREHSPAILLFHDSLGCVATWRDFPEELARATRLSVIAYDRLGFGRSDPHAGRLPLTFIRDEAETVPGICAALGVATIIPFGHSVGGGMAIATAARWPERCVAVVTESAQSFIEDQTLAGVRAARETFQEPDQFERVVRRHGAKAQWVLSAWTDTWLAPDFADWCLDDDLRQVRCPTLTMHGDADEYGSVAHVVRIMSLVQGSLRGVILRNCGHLPHREATVRVRSEVMRFLTRRSLEREGL